MTEAMNIMSVRELIDSAFGDANSNKVNHKLIQTILIILARQLRVLERQVEIVMGPLVPIKSETSITVTEVKLQANVDHKKKSKTAKGKVTLKEDVGIFSTKETPKPTVEISTSDKVRTKKSESLEMDTETKSKAKMASLDKTKYTPEKYQTKSNITTSEQTTLEKRTEKSTSSIDKEERLFSFQESDLKFLEKIEELREMELRVIHQRADSREMYEKTPTPMASLESVEKQYEKLLIVERVPTGQGAEGRKHTGGRAKTPRLSIVTQEEFKALAQAVHQLQEKFSPGIGYADFPENAQLMNELRKGASLTEAMAALQLSARVEAAEKALEKMLSLVTVLARKTPGIDVAEIMEKASFPNKEQTENVFEFLNDEYSTKSPDHELKANDDISTRQLISDKSKADVIKNCITYEELDNAMKKLHGEIYQVVNKSTNQSNTEANIALKTTQKIEQKLDEALDVGDRMFDLEKVIMEYTDKINVLDTGLSSQMTYFQEQLTQMQHDLEYGLDAMAESLANTEGDTTAVTELNNRFHCLQYDIDATSMMQKELKETQDALSLNLQSLWEQIEILRDTKSDRDEVTDALRDKAGLDALNGLVSRLEFDAVYCDFEKRIAAAYDKFNNQEIIWQKAIDELLREIGEKADYIQLESLQASIDSYINKFGEKIKTMSEILGEPRVAAAVQKKLYRDMDCLSCAAPAHLEPEHLSSPPLLAPFGTSRPLATGPEATSKPAEDGDHGICYPGLPVLHKVDPRAPICRRYCGGGLQTMNRTPFGVIIKPAMRKSNTAIGTDGKLYSVDDDTVQKPCIPCNIKKSIATPEPSETEPAPNAEEHGSDMTPSFFKSQDLATMDDGFSVTPLPPPLD